MPNSNNILAPVTLIANGRSGTSLIQSIFQNHPAFDICGETAAQIFGTFHATDRLEGLVRADYRLAQGVDFKERSGKATRAAFLDTFRNPNKRFWMHKPIGVPWVWQALGQRGMSEEERIKWYWQVLAYTFPEGTNITVLRHPYDVTLSAEKYWGITLKQAWGSIVRMARILGHRDAAIKHAVVYDSLVQEPLAETERLFAAIERPFNPASLRAFEHIWVPEMGARKVALEENNPRLQARFTRKEEWDRVRAAGFSQEDHNTLSAMWQRYGAELTF